MLHSLIIDDFLEDFSGWRTWADGCRYTEETNDVDGISYPGICRDLPTYGAIKRLSAIMGQTITLNALFMRLSLAGTPVPHWAHHDGAMGQFSLMVYMNRAEDCQGGTALLRHKDGEPDHGTWLRDTNQPERWQMVSACEMVPNRAFIFRSTLWHSALPIGGFGDSSSNGRLVLTGFFDL